MLHRLLPSAPIRHKALHLTTPDLFRTSFAPFHTTRPLLRILSAASPQMATSEKASFKSNVPRASSPSEGTGIARSTVAKTQLKNHPQATMVSNSVNKTALHPGGVEYVLNVLNVLSVGEKYNSDCGQTFSGAYRTGGRTSRDCAH